MIGALTLSIALALDPSTSVRKILFHDTDIPTVYVKLGFVTTINLPSDELVMEVHDGDQKFFEPTWNANVVWIKPMALKEQEGRVTNIAVFTSTGKTIPFIVKEVSKTPEQQADLMVVLDKGQEQSKQQFVPAKDVQMLQDQIAHLNSTLAQQQADAALRVREAKMSEANSIRHGYELFGKKGKEDFRAAIYRDERFTYIETQTQEEPSVFEIKDGKPLKVEAIFRDGHYVIQHLVDEGELTVGKSSIRFRYTG